MQDDATEGVAEHSFLGCNHQSTCVPQPLCSAALVPNLLLRRDEGSGNPSAVNPASEYWHSLGTLTRDLVWWQWGELDIIQSTKQITEMGDYFNGKENGTENLFESINVPHLLSTLQQLEERWTFRSRWMGSWVPGSFLQNLFYLFLIYFTMKTSWLDGNKFWFLDVY